mgnify:CR=1 FL=1
MQAVYRQLVTIITEAALESELTRQLERLGAQPRWAEQTLPIGSVNDFTGVG